MRKFLALIFCTTLILLGVSTLQPARSAQTSIRDRAHGQAEMMAKLHRGDAPIPSPDILAMENLIQNYYKKSEIPSDLRI